MNPKLFIATYLDTDIAVALAEQLRHNGFDAISARELGQHEWSDAEHLAYAVSQERAIVTRNRDDFLRLYDEYWQAGKTHYGVIIVTHLEVGELLRRMLTLLDSVTADEMMNTVRYLAEYR